MSTDVSSTVEPKPATQTLAQSNKQLAGLFKKSAEAEQTLKSSFAEALKLIKSDRRNFTDEVILESLKDKRFGRGLSEASAKVELSRIRDLISEKGEERYNALQEGKITIQMARKVERPIDPVTGKPKGRGRPEQTSQDKFKKTVEALCKATVSDLPELTKDEFLGFVSQAFDAAIAERDANKKAVEEARSKGLVSGGTEGKGGFEPSVPQTSEPVAA